MKFSSPSRGLPLGPDGGPLLQYKDESGRGAKRWWPRAIAPRTRSTEIGALDRSSLARTGRAHASRRGCLAEMRIAYGRFSPPCVPGVSPCLDFRGSKRSAGPVQVAVQVLGRRTSARNTDTSPDESWCLPARHKARAARKILERVIPFAVRPCHVRRADYMTLPRIKAPSQGHGSFNRFALTRLFNSEASTVRDLDSPRPRG